MTAVRVLAPARPQASLAEAAGLAVGAAALAPAMTAATLAAGVGAAHWAHADPRRRRAVALRSVAIVVLLGLPAVAVPPHVLPGLLLPTLAVLRGLDRRRPGESLHAVREGWLRGACWAATALVVAGVADVGTGLPAAVGVVAFAVLLPYLVATTAGDDGDDTSTPTVRVRLAALGGGTAVLALGLVAVVLVAATVQGGVGDGAVAVVLQPFVDVAVSVASVLALVLWGVAAVIAGALPDVPLIDPPDVEEGEVIPGEAAAQDAGSLPDVVAALLGVALVVVVVALLVWVVRRSLEARPQPPRAIAAPVFRERRTRVAGGPSSTLDLLRRRRPLGPTRGPHAERVRRAFRAVAAASAPALEDGAPPARSALDVGRRVADAVPAVRDESFRLVVLYHAARYGPQDVPAARADEAEALGRRICETLGAPAGAFR